MIFDDCKSRQQKVNWSFGNGCDCRYWGMPKGANPFRGTGDQILKEVWEHGWRWQDVWGRQRADET